MGKHVASTSENNRNRFIRRFDVTFQIARRLIVLHCCPSFSIVLHRYSIGGLFTGEHRLPMSFAIITSSYKDPLVRPLVDTCRFIESHFARCTSNMQDALVCCTKERGVSALIIHAMHTYHLFQMSANSGSSAKLAFNLDNRGPLRRVMCSAHEKKRYTSCSDIITKPTARCWSCVIHHRTGSAGQSTEGSSHKQYGYVDPGEVIPECINNLGNLSARLNNLSHMYHPAWL